MKIRKKLLTRLKNIKLLILDVDGVLTDGSIYIGEDGSEICKIFNVKDGFGIKNVMQYGITVAIISGRFAHSVDYRLRSLGVEYIYQNQSDKNVAFTELKTKVGVQDMDIAYVGDDCPDLSIMSKVAFAVAVQDAHSSVKKIAHWITKLPGGCGAVREICDLLVEVKLSK